MDSFVCPICQNSDPKYIGYLNGKPYCRYCISFQGIKADELIRKPGLVKISFNYSLSEEQKALSHQILENYQNNIDTLVWAICGAGKTELVFEVIAHSLSLGKNVAFALPRKDVVIELYHRFKNVFPKEKVIAVYGGNNEDLIGDLIILTTHQLYRYDHYFDLLIIDEIDAFPYKDNPLLEKMFFRALRGHYVMMSATPNDEIINKFKNDPSKAILMLNTRFHKHPLPVPKVEIYLGLTKIYRLIKLLKQYQKENKPTFVFTPTISLCEGIYKIIKIFVRYGEYVHSKRTNRPQIIDNFKNNQYSYLITTAVLERGVTISNLQVIIYQADHDIYDKGTLIQISGRVGRKMNAPSGDVIFLVDKVNENIQNAIREIRDKNLFL